MNNLVKFLTVSLFILSSCNSTAPASRVISTDSCNCDNSRKGVAAYHYKDDTICHTVVIVNKQKAFIDFDLVTCNSRTHKQSRLTGRAGLSIGINSEMDMDEDGSGYAVNLFVYKAGACTVDLRFDADSGRLLQIKEYNCEGLHDVSCPFGADNILVRE